jgi:hypothetical protein
MNTNDMLGTVIVGAVALKLLDDDDHHHHHRHKKGRKHKGLLP